MTPTTLTIQKRDHVWLVALNRPEKRNAFNLAMLRELAETYARYEDDDEARCLVLFANGDHFTAGLDLAEVGPAVRAGSGLGAEHGLDPLDLSGRRRTKPVVCAVQGYCFTIGIELLLASDIRIASSDTRFSQMEVKRGIMPFGGATLRFPEVAGWGNAMRWILTGDFFDANEAYRIGLVQQVANPGEQVDAAIAIATSIAKQAPLAVRATLASARTSMEQGREAALASLMQEARALMESEDAAEGLRSFVERRDAVFRGR